VKAPEGVARHHVEAPLLDKILRTALGGSGITESRVRDALVVTGVYVANQTALAAFQALKTGLPGRIWSDMFF